MDVDPSMLRQSLSMMNNMSPEMQKMMTEQAQKMYASGTLPKGMGMPSQNPSNFGSNNITGAQSSPVMEAK
jgi:hypothetical protein